MPHAGIFLASQMNVPWKTTSGTITAVVVVVSLVLAVLCSACLYFLRRHATEYAKSSTRGRLQYALSIYYIFLIYSSILEGSVAVWLLAQYDHEDRFPTVGSRDGLRIALFCSCWTLLCSNMCMVLVLRPSQWARKHTTASLILQDIWTAVTWGVWVAATATMTRVLPLLTPQANCAGADYCEQLKAALRLAILEVLLLSMGALYLGWAMWKAFRSRPTHY